MTTIMKEEFLSKFNIINENFESVEFDVVVGYIVVE